MSTASEVRRDEIAYAFLSKLDKKKLWRVMGGKKKGAFVKLFCYIYGRYRPIGVPYPPNKLVDTALQVDAGGYDMSRFVGFLIRCFLEQKKYEENGSLDYYPPLLLRWFPDFQKETQRVA